MMKKILLFCTLFLAVSVKGQDLRIPNTPAFSILDFEPTAVMRPTSAKKLSSDLLNSFDKDGKLIMNLGLEVTPCWLKNHPLLSRHNYLNPSVWQTMKQTFTLSAATVKDTFTGNNNLGAGFRVEVIKGNLNNKVAGMEAEILVLETIKGIIISAGSAAAASPANISAAISTIDARLKGLSPAISPKRIAEYNTRAKDLSLDSYNDVSKFCRALSETYDAESKAATISLRETINKRTGFSLEAAGASKFVTGSGGKALQRIGGWLNANFYMSDKDAWTITSRLMAYTIDTTRVNTDVGISYIRMEKDFNISVEGMLRWFRIEVPDININNMPITRVEKLFTYRLAAQASYTVIKDIISINMSFGKDFKDTQLKTDGLFSILGINYALFERRIIPEAQNY